MSSKVIIFEKKVNDLYKEYARIIAESIRELYNAIDLKFKLDEIERVSNKILRLIEDSSNDLLMKIDTNEIEIEF